MNLPHIETGVDEAGRPWVEVRDTELFVYIEDFLAGQELEYLWVDFHNHSENPTRNTMTFGEGLGPKIQDALMLLDPEVVRRIYLLNNEGTSA